MSPRSRIALVLLGALLAGTALAVGSAPPDAAALEAAREALRVQHAAWQRLREEYERLLARGELRADEAADYRGFLRELEDRVGAERRRVERLSGATPTNAAAGETPSALPDGFHRGTTTSERVAALDAELGSSLSEFDEMLLREQQAVAAKSRPAAGAPGGGGSQGAGEAADGKARDGAGDEGRTAVEGAAGAESAGGDEGGPPDGRSAQSGRGAKRAPGTGEDGRSGTTGVEGTAPAGDGDAADEQVAAVGEERAGGKDGGVSESREVPADVGDGEDDDIVARQIREAAERERDPALREKLWEEYRRYKKSRRGTAGSP